MAVLPFAGLGPPIASICRPGGFWPTRLTSVVNAPLDSATARDAAD